MTSLAADLERHPEVARLREPLLRAAGSGRVYLVGGAVRDLLLGAAHVDVDLVVEGDAVAVARALARETGERLVVHGAFGTAVVGDVDLATARAERYAEPGALPEVWPASLSEDLVRRDFSINAMAVALHGEPFGDAARPARRLGRSRRRHRPRPARRARSATTRPGSCAPRATSARFGFALDEATAEQARATARADLVTTVGGPRLRDALLLLLRGGRRHAGAGAARVARRAARDRARPARGRDRPRRSSTRWPRSPPTSTAPGRGWRCSLRSLPPRERGRLLQWLRLRRVDERVVRRAAAAEPEALADLPDEAALVVGGDAARQWLVHDRHVRLDVDGAVLTAELGIAGGPGAGPDPAHAAGREARRRPARPGGGAGARPRARLTATGRSRRSGRTAGRGS